MISYTFSILQLDCIPKIGAISNYVCTSHWKCIGTDGTYEGKCYATVNFEVNPEKLNYIPFDKITEQMAIEWTIETLGKNKIADIYVNIDSQIEDQINTKISSPILPWKAIDLKNI